VAGIRPLNKSLLDTDIFSEITKAANQTVVGHATAYRKAFSRYTISAVTFMEVIRGHQKKQALRQLQNFLAATVSEEVIPFDRPAAELAGRIAGELERNGQSIGLADPMIAAIALHHGLELVTGNTAHFQRVQQLGYPLILVNWRL
jgi:tRNA(fMet)-specific endonuclease VapC